MNEHCGVHVVNGIDSTFICTRERGHTGEHQAVTGGVEPVEDPKAQAYADLSALLNERADMWENEYAASHRHPVVLELRDLANAYRTYAEGVGTPSMESLRIKRRQAEEERDRFRGALVGVVRAWTDEGPQPDHHRHIRAAVRHQWPTLTTAVVDAVRIWEES